MSDKLLERHILWFESELDSDSKCDDGSNENCEKTGRREKKRRGKRIVPTSNLHPNLKNDSCHFRVMQFNTLADELSDAFPFVDSSYLTWDYRKNAILEEIKRNSADIVALEEVDHFKDFFLPEMKRFGYEGEGLMKTNANNGYVCFSRVISLKG